MCTTLEPDLVIDIDTCVLLLFVSQLSACCSASLAAGTSSSARAISFAGVGCRGCQRKSFSTAKSAVKSAASSTARWCASSTASVSATMPAKPSPSTNSKTAQSLGNGIHLENSDNHSPARMPVANISSERPRNLKKPHKSLRWVANMASNADAPKCNNGNSAIHKPRTLSTKPAKRALDATMSGRNRVTTTAAMQFMPWQ
mmetsp:Transcript_53225/g.149427  ORF Transcript_53225/g.149427 Transcript_53225/m.149427 type:complete len:201 (+) Transcript_53225:514-1116(+)